MGADRNITQSEYVCRQTDIREAFESFQEAYRNLADSHQHLEQWVSELALALDDARRGNATLESGQVRAASRLANILQAMPAGVLILDGEGRIQEFNSVAAEMLTGVSAGRQWREVVAESFTPRWDDGHDITLRGGLRANISTQALEGEPGQIVLIKDVTQTRGLQDELNRHRRLASMGEMAAALAHQVRTPLASAILYLSNVRMGRGDEALRQKCVDHALDRLQHLERLVADMLLFARGNMFDTADVRLDELLQELTTEAADVDTSVDFRIEVIDTTGGVVLRGNRDALASALRNLIDNARQACEGAGSICIEAVMEADTLALRFTDDGPGIPENLRETIFEPFFTTRIGGSGLGLAVTQSVVCAHGGDISLENGRERGTTFVVRLPAGARRNADTVTGAAVQ
jgi:two-component system sensor histidine kinase FlrB